MAYIALYREFRPKTFSDIVGQEHITKTLKNQILQKRVAHAYLLCGTRGTGKTTTAKVLAKAVNCLNPKDGEPCGVCEICTGIDEGNIMDIIEIDAASNNGVDNIRELRDDVKYLPSKCKYKVYIIDEVHMLSTAAFNALLKTLEEPPSHVIFILATTEYQKIPVTILSRCQRFDYKRISMDNIVIRLSSIAKQDNIYIEDRTLRLIARCSDGALRDAISIFDQCISIGGKEIKYDDVEAMLGITTDEYLLKITDAIAKNSISTCIMLIDDIISNGKDTYQFIKDLIMHFRNLLICSVSNSPDNIINTSSETLKEIELQTKKFSTEAIIRNINILSEAENNSKWSSQPRVILEMAIFKICNKELYTDMDAILDRISKLEQIITNNNIIIEKTTNEEININKEYVKKPELNKTNITEKKQINKEEEFYDLQYIQKKWPDIISVINAEGNKQLFCNICDAKPIDINNEYLTIIFKYEFNKKFAEKQDNKKFIEDCLTKACGINIKIKCKSEKDEIAIDKKNEVDIVQKAKNIFGEDIVEVEE